MSRLTEAEERLAEDLGRHVITQMMRALGDAGALCSRPKQRAAIAVRVMAGAVGLACAEIDIAEGRKVPRGEVSPEALALVQAVIAGLDRTALAAARQDEGGERA